MKIVAIDTEFSNDRSYVPILSLIQIYDGNEIQVFDAIEKDLRRNEFLVNLLQNAKIMKIFHSARLDIESIYHYFKILPQNITDTQLIAKEVKIGNEISYVDLVKKYFNINIEKKFQYSNWIKRPLKQEQIEYAKLDVKYLIDIYHYLLNEVKFEVNIENQIINLLKKDNFVFNEEKFWHKKLFKQYKKHPLQNKIKKVALWRENLAFKLNKPREHIFCWNEFITQINKDKISLSQKFQMHEDYLNKIMFSEVEY